MALHEPVAIRTAGHQAILDDGLGVEFAHQEKTYRQQQQCDRHASQARGLPVGRLVVFLDQPGTLLLHGKRHFTAGRGAERKSRLR